jgi:choline kinase
LKFVVLVAGVGSRLRPLTEDRPKCLVEVNGKSILERLLDQADRTGLFDEAILITGYRADAVEQFVKEWLKDHSMPVRLVHNDNYDETNNGYSLWCARHLLNDSFLLSDGDLVLDDEIIRMVAESPISALAVDQSSKLDEEAMKFAISDDGYITALSKDMRITEAKGESIGMCVIQSADVPNVIAELDQLVQNNELNDYYERAFIELIDKGWRLGVHDIGGHRWVEIDDHSDLARAQESFASAL